jgi:hypothetical protein
MKDLTKLRSFYSEYCHSCVKLIPPQLEHPEQIVYLCPTI